MIASFLPSTAFDGITELCFEIEALKRLPSGRLWKYASDSSALTFVTRPVTRICRSRAAQ
jgi:hypothetical protein